MPSQDWASPVTIGCWSEPSRFTAQTDLFSLASVRVNMIRLLSGETGTQGRKLPLITACCADPSGCMAVRVSCSVLGSEAVNTIHCPSGLQTGEKSAVE